MKPKAKPPRRRAHLKLPPRTTCARCQRLFQPVATGLRTIPWSRCCATCQCRNLFDGLDLLTPPGLLDQHTKNPTLTEWEFRRKIAQT